MGATEGYMRLRLLLALSMAVLSPPLFAQDLAPRAYVITPLHSNAVTVTWSYNTGGLDFNGASPIGDAKGSYHVPVFSFYHAFNFFGRSANVTASLPYAVGNFTGELNNQQRSVYRSGLLDFGARLSVNLYAGRCRRRIFVSGSRRCFSARACG
jgi:hypothetical protein